MEATSKVETGKGGALEGLTEIMMTGGPPWGFTISGGSEFGTELFVKKVAEDGIARKVGGLKEGDRLVFINDVKCTSRANAIETVKMGKSELKIQLKRTEGVNDTTLHKSSAPKRSNSFYGTVVEDMLDSVSSDISSTHYSLRRNTIRGDKGSPRKSQTQETTVKETADGNSYENNMKDVQVPDISSPVKIQNLLSPSDENNKFRGNQHQGLPRNFQRVKVKSVKVTSMVPGVKNDISEQLKSKLETSPDFKKEDANLTKRNPILMKEEDAARQTRSMDEGKPSWNDSLVQREATTPPAAVSSRIFKPLNDSPEIDSTAVNVTQARSMFERISKSQETLDMIEPKNPTQRRSPTLEKKETDSVKTRRPLDQAINRPNIPSSVLNEERQPNHHHTKSLPLEVLEGPRREIRRPGVVPNRRSNRRIRPKSAHFPSEEEKSEAQNLPLGYGAVSTNNRMIHGRKSIATCAPSAERLYKKESSFRHSSEDLCLIESKDLAGRSERKSATLPANQMREAAKRFHQELMRKDPKFRYSFGQMEPVARPAHLGSSTGGSSSSSLSSSQDQLNTADQARRLSNGPSVFSRACSTSSLDSSPGPQEAVITPTDDDNTIISRLLREQRMNNNGNLVRIEEEARSPRGKSLVTSEVVERQETIETDEIKGKRTISIQTDFVSTISKKRESFSKRSLSDHTPHSFTSPVQPFTAIETCIDDVDPSFIYNTSADAENRTATPEKATSHSKEPSCDSITELDEINRNMEQNAVEGGKDDVEEFPVTDIDALPPPPDELLVASPPEKEKPLRVINRKKRDHHVNYGASRNSSCVSTDSNISTSTMDSGIGVRAYSMSDSSPRNSPTRVTLEFDDDYHHGYDEGFKGSREELLNDDCQTYSPESADELQQNEPKDDELPGDSPAKFDSPVSGSRPNSATLSPRIEELDQKKATLIDSMQKKIEELKLQEQEIAEEIKLNEDLGKRVQGLVERKATQTEFSKYELFIGELNKIVALLLSLTQRLHRYEQMLQDLDISEEEDKQKKETLISKIDKLRSQHEEACHLREVNDKRGENVATFLDKYFNEEEFADFQYYVDMKSQLALMQSEIKEKVKLGEERFQALNSTGKF